ncbi:hypothetical protein, partial [Termitidicoccus mucosus]|uniref:hypothetical protein n=1 Tax=Termitidicoccus mucosus TaxID=1184151 RepID=UPI002FEE34BA
MDTNSHSLTMRESARLVEPHFCPGIFGVSISVVARRKRGFSVGRRLPGDAERRMSPFWQPGAGGLRPWCACAGWRHDGGGGRFFDSVRRIGLQGLGVAFLVRSVRAGRAKGGLSLGQARPAAGFMDGRAEKGGNACQPKEARKPVGWQRQPCAGRGHEASAVFSLCWQRPANLRAPIVARSGVACKVESEADLARDAIIGNGARCEEIPNPQGRSSRKGK